MFYIGETSVEELRKIGRGLALTEIFPRVTFNVVENFLACFAQQSADIEA